MVPHGIGTGGVKDRYEGLAEQELRKGGMDGFRLIFGLNC